MPQLGLGLIPSSPLGSEYQNLMRRTFSRFAVVALYNSNPMQALLLRNAQIAKGGVSPITVEVQLGSYVNSAWISPSGSFAQPQETTGEQNAEFNLFGMATPISYYGLESLVSTGAEAAVRRLSLKMNDMKNSALSGLSTALFGSNASNSLQMNGLLDAYDDGTTVATYGGISRSIYPNWKSTKKTSAGAILTRSAFIPYLLSAAKASGGEPIDFVVTSMSNWTTLLTDFMSIERFNVDPKSQFGKDDNINSGFRGLMLGDTAIFFDMNMDLTSTAMTETAFGINSKYLGYYIHEDANFSWSGWYSTIPNMQMGAVGVMLSAMNCVCTNPRSGIQITGITGGASL